ncbi:MAG: type ii secretion system protein e, type IV pilus assembly protein PilB [Candidatus Gottesmanbacteria bacterium GW2011_GWA2_43_14]|uniref:Type ii secretion system protein e, type IV pilus assembly protein PilB n=1 Tax=Candidatus Gottesmanbacteria bacterium GW2011_GWA2_43_14 TaxID=1618443 RepID=A0A0G1FNW4_9BACT|nr:MAG: type ii secretion system protein e, type IV pilus assembly protein PilB [Candidatus Gottesmanbacteria bacterium GW2011_GWA2_43_14]
MDFGQKLLQILTDQGELTVEAAEEIKLAAINSDTPVVDILLKRHVVDEEKLLKAKAKAMNVPFVSLLGRGISQDILSLLPEPVARRYKLIPLEIDKNSGKLSVAMTDPLNLPLIEFLEQKSGKAINPCLANEQEILSKINEQYSQGLAFDVTEALKETISGGVRTVKAENINQIIKEAPIAKIVSTVLEYSVKNRASDIHIEPQETRTRIRYRIDGVLHEKLALPRTVHEAVLSRIKILANMKIDEKRLPQDGRFNFKMGDEEVDLRVSTLPTIFGEKVTMRLLRKTGGIPSLQDLGLTGVPLKNLQAAVSKPHGIVLVTGPTGSGKTTTLYSILTRLNSANVNIITLEDPVEYEIVGLNQVQVNPQAGLTFASGMRSFLRQDPNIILVGEIRDTETTQLAVQAALTGHLVFSTLHTNNAATTIPRLLDLGAEPFLIVSVLNAVEAQRIVRRICNSCKIEFSPDPQAENDMRTVLGNLIPSGELKLFKGRGCEKCNHTGYLGRVGIFETLIVSPAIARLIMERATAETIEKQSVSEGMITLKQDGYLKVLQGTTTLEEIFRVAQE